MRATIVSNQHRIASILLKDPSALLRRAFSCRYRASPLNAANTCVSNGCRRCVMRPGTRCGSILCAAQLRITELVMCVGHASMVRMIQLSGSTGARAAPSVFTQSANSAPSAHADLRRTRCARVPRYCSRSSSNSRLPMLFSFTTTTCGSNACTSSASETTARYDIAERRCASGATWRRFRNSARVIEAGRAW